MDALRELEAVYTEWERRVEDKGERAGLIKGIEALCRVFDIDLSDARRQRLASWDVSRLEQVLADLSASREWPDISDEPS
ncbi:MAG: hypothetical protein MJE77_13860 [Proteobacteria bacterium]|nr:hypothetical protein [Pseudomonadota bacterium]